MISAHSRRAGVGAGLADPSLGTKPGASLFLVFRGEQPARPHGWDTEGQALPTTRSSRCTISARPEKPRIEGMSIDEIGSTLGTGTNATKHSIFRAVQKLRRSLEPFVSVAK